MAIRLPGIIHAKQILRKSNLLPNQSTSLDVPKGYIAVYVGESKKKKFIIPMSFLYQPSFQRVLCMAEEEYGFDHPMSGLTILCTESDFIERTSHLGGFSLALE